MWQSLFETWSDIWNDEIQNSNLIKSKLSHQTHFSKHFSPVQIHELRVQIHQFKFTSYEFNFTS